MPHLVLLAVLSAWAFWTLRDRPLREYTPIYFVGGILGFVAEFTFSGIFQFYELRVHLLPDPFADVRLAAVFDKLGNLPLIAVLFARYARSNLLVPVVVGAVSLGLLEWLFLVLGAISYQSWHPGLTAVAFSCYFYLIGRAAQGKIPIPLWLQVDAVAFWGAFLMDILFHGAFWLWHYTVPVLGDPQGDSRLIALLFNGLVVAPVATAVSVVPALRNRVAVLGAAGLLLGLECLLLVSGILVYDGWNLGLAALRYLYGVLLPFAYAHWYTKEPRTIPPWAPPVPLRRK